MNDITVVPLNEEYRSWVKDVLTREWGSSLIIARGKQYQAEDLPGFIALLNNEPKGLITYSLQGEECELITFNSFKLHIGIGQSMLDAVKNIAMQNQCKKIVVITTNDNLAALRYYQLRGFNINTVYPNSMEKIRKIKPQIPLIGMNNIPLRDEIELSLILNR